MATLTACEQATIWLAEAKAALHALSIGSKIEALGHADKSMRYTAANVDALRAYIRNLQNQVDACNGVRVTSDGFRFQPRGW